jgi:hypothetical protein
MSKLHLALSVASIERTVSDYSERFGKQPDVVIPGTYALWRTEHLNVSVRTVESGQVGQLRHLGWEVDDAPVFTSDTDCNGIVWERFTAEQQAAEINEAWPEAACVPNVR